jgi:FKBP-type peptidyl-prolyl cis-trans isomerase FkpA
MMMKFLSVVAVAGALALTGCTKCSKKDDAPQVATGQVAGQTTIDTRDLKIETLKQGTGTVAAASGKKVTVHYTGSLSDGKVFDSSETRKAPFTFTLGQGQVIPGWDKGVEGMKVGERRRLTIPSNLGYGEKGVGNIIPPNATLIFEVELLNVE